MQDDQYLDAETSDNAIAIVGMACHLPGANNLEQYWANLRDGVESVRFFSDQELLAAGEDPVRLADPNYVRAQPELLGFDRFDAGFWGFSPQDAAVTDPAHRLFLEVAYQALEHSGHTGLDTEGTVGVFASSGASLYWMQNLLTNPSLMEEMGEFLVRHTGNDMNFLATRLSYELDLKGPSVNVQTACSSGLVAIHSAIQSLLGGECDIALAGASTVLVPQQRGYLYRQGEIMSPDGHCRPFDAHSAGTVFGSGAGAVVLRRLDDALVEGDVIHAVILGSAINNDGADKVGYLAPGVEGQAAVIAEALGVSDVSAADISYVEAHGTGTLVGDPIEFEALNQVFQEATQAQHFCRIGSVKANIGHLGEAAGMASVIKAVLALEHGQIPPMPNFQSPNPEMNVAQSPFRMATELADWQDINGRRLCGVTSLGAGGTNAHLILESAESVRPKTATPRSSAVQRPALLLLSAKSEPALRSGCLQLGQHLADTADTELVDTAYTLTFGRRNYRHRAALVADQCVSAASALSAAALDQVVIRQAEENPRRLVFLLPGGGAQYSGMGAELYASQPAYAEAFDAALLCLEPGLAGELRQLVLAPEKLRETATKELERPSRSLPALFATEYALAQLLSSWGAQPAALIGHSMGENTAACLAGVLSLNHAMALVARRGELFEQVAPGAMLSVSLSKDALAPYLEQGLDIAAVNAPELSVLSGPVEKIDVLQQTLDAADVQCSRIHINVAAHSAMLEGILDEFEQFCRSITLSPPRIPFTSNLTGTWITDQQATDPSYWVEHLRNTVRFADNVATVSQTNDSVLVEIGPGRTLASLASACGVAPEQVFNSMRHPADPVSDAAIALRTLGGLWACGVEINWQSYWDEPGQRLALPGYAFQRQRYWIEPGQSEDQQPLQASVMSTRPPIDDWFGLHSWSQTGRPKPQVPAAKKWLLFADDDALRSQLINSLHQQAGPVELLVVRRQATEFTVTKDGFALDPAKPEQFEALFSVLAERAWGPEQVVYMWPLQAQPLDPTKAIALADFERLQPQMFWGLFHLAKQLADVDQNVVLSVLASNLFAPARRAVQVEQATLVGPVAVLPHESPGITTRLIDVARAAGAVGHSFDCDGICQELLASGEDRFVVLDATTRWVRSIAPSYVPAPAPEQNWVTAGGTYLISGGLGGIGLVVAAHLARLGAHKLCLVSRTGLPDRDQWQTAAHSSLIAQRIAAVQEIEALGAQVAVVSADVGDEAALSTALHDVVDSLAEVNGVIHAAGSMDDQLLMVKSQASARAVMSAKIQGGIVLDRLFADVPLDFFVLFSSIASHLGLPGQVDYCAANAFLDALAHARSQRAAGYTAVINWSAWQDVGMAAQAAGLVSRSAVAGESTLATRPMLQQHTQHSERHATYEHSFAVATDWMLAEHRVRDAQALVSGTGFLELSYAAFADFNQRQGQQTRAANVIEISELAFVDAFQVRDNEVATLRVDVDASDGACNLTFYSGDIDEPNVTCTIAAIADQAPAPVNLQALLDECPHAMPTQGRFLAQSFMAFGPRWGCIDRIVHNEARSMAVITLSLQPEFAPDLAQHPLHPALMDMATGGAQFLIQGFDSGTDFYVPLRYERVRIYDALPAQLFSVVRCHSSTIDLFAQFDVTIVDATGRVCVEIDAFTMKRLEQRSSMTSADATLPAVATPSYAQLSLADILRHAIAPAQGLDALDRILSAQDQVQTVVSSVDTLPWLAALDATGSSAEQAAERGLVFVHDDQVDPDADPEIPAAEQVLRELPCFSAVAIRCFGAAADGARAVAFVVSELADAQAELASINAALAQSAMTLRIASVSQRAEMPLNQSGDLDRGQLLDPLSSESQYEAPEGPTEQKLEQLWGTLLGAPRVGRCDNFFELGGHSLLLTRLISRVQKAFERKMPMEQAYQNPTISAWADLLDASDTPAEPAVKIGRADRSKFKVS